MGVLSNTLLWWPVLIWLSLLLAAMLSPDKLQSLKTKVEQTKGKLESNDQVQLSSITREDILGDLFYAGALGYFAEFNALSHVSNLQSNSYSSLLPSFGTYGYEPQVSYFFGLPRSIETGGIAMDLDSVTYVAAASDGEKQKTFNKSMQIGMLSSALEHAIPEQMFSTEENPVEAISAVKALQKASVDGQSIYHITNANKGSILPKINHNSSTISEIQAALNAGKEVITHTDAVGVLGWNGAGYILLDPEIGSGAYKISGGMNGGFFKPSVGLNGTFLSFSSNITDIAELVKSILITIIDVMDDKLGPALTFFNEAISYININKNCPDEAAEIIILHLGIFLAAFFMTNIANGILSLSKLPRPKMLRAIFATVLVGTVIGTVKNFRRQALSCSK